jgi:putative ATP-binding cassette transporter
LERLGLERLGPLLEQSSRWDVTLSEEEQQSLVFARVLLHSPAWLIIDEALEALEEQVIPKVGDILATDLKGAGVLYIGRPGVQDVDFGRVLHLVNATEGDATASQPPTSTAAADHALPAIP